MTEGRVLTPTAALYAARAGAQGVLRDALERMKADQQIVDRCRAQLRQIEADIVESFGRSDV